VTDSDDIDVVGSDSMRVTSWPGFEPNGACFNGGDPALDFRVPGGLGIGIGGTIEARKDLCRQFCPSVRLEPERVRQKVIRRLGHAPTLRPSAGGQPLAGGRRLVR
jgi:hypothetical protein